MDYELIVRIIINFLPVVTLVISMDRTNWKYGQSDINIFMLCAHYKGIGIPLLWALLPKKGNSNTDEHIALLSKFIAVFGKGRINHLLADREFIGQDWFSFLIKEQITFYIRIRNNSLVQTTNGKEVKAYRLFAHKQAHTISNVKLGNEKLNLTGLYLGKGEYLIVAFSGKSEQALNIYKDRWQIETFFSCLKTRGLRLEETHMNQPEKLNNTRPIKTKAHGRKANNLFRYGLDHLRKIISPFNQVIGWLKIYLNLFTQSIHNITLKYP